MLRKPISISMLLAATVGVPLLAANHRALIMGVGEYQSPIPNLKGIDLDVQHMRQVASLMGFEAGQTHVLQNKQVTLANIRLEFKNFLSQAGPEDRVLIYFSGHGAQVKDQNGDEEDGLDELWVTADTTLDAQGKLEGYLLDDEVDILVKNLNSKHILFILDSCHSGSATRGLGSSYQVKEAGFEGAITAETRALTPVTPSKNQVLLAAAQDSETAAATPDGSALTAALFVRVQKLSQEKKPLILKEVRDSIEPDVLKIKGDQHPVLSGDEGLEREDWFFGRGIMVAPPADPGPVSNDMLGNLNKIYAAASSRMNCTLAGGPALKAGTKVHVGCDLPFAGYLDIVNLGDGDPAPITIFPNQYVTENRISKGPLTLPSPERFFNIDVDLPSGVVTQHVSLYFFLNAANVNLYQTSPQKGAAEFVEFRADSARSLVASAPAGYAAARIEFTIQK